MKYIIFGCLLILTGIAALTHEPTQSPNSINSASQEITIPHHVMYQQQHTDFNVEPSLVKFTSDHEMKTDTIDLRPIESDN